MTQSERLLHRIAGHITNSGYRYPVSYTHLGVERFSDMGVTVATGVDGIPYAPGISLIFVMS